MALTSFYLLAFFTVAVFCGDKMATSTRRNKILHSESLKSIGGNVSLSAKEKVVDELVLRLKKTELDSAYRGDFTAIQSSFVDPATKDQVTRSQVFKLLQKIPKGASLHTHLLAGVSVDYIIDQITYRDNLYGGHVRYNGQEVFKLKFLDNVSVSDSQQWVKVSTMRQQNPNFDQWLRGLITLSPSDCQGTVKTLWTKFKQIFTTLYDMLCQKHVFEDYVYNLLLELHNDNIFYTELRGTFMPLFDHDVNNTRVDYNSRDFLDIFIQAVDKFKRDYPQFLGVKYIHSIYRGIDPQLLREGLKELLEMKELFPDFIAGFDFVGFEEEGNCLDDYGEVLREVGGRLKFFFHAGETPWIGHRDLNLVDAVLLNSTRIGHGFALTKHPDLLQMAKDSDIAIELCPISNQVLKLNSDPRNHPATHLIATGYPIVIGNDDPSVWNATGLSYDWYIAFMAMTSRSSGLGFLKQLAINSIRYSAMSEREKGESMERWTVRWEAFLDLIG